MGMKTPKSTSEVTVDNRTVILNNARNIPFRGPLADAQ